MGIEMDYFMESPLEVLSRAALQVQNEEREAALKRSGETSAGHSRSNSGGGNSVTSGDMDRDYSDLPCKRARESPPLAAPSGGNHQLATYGIRSHERHGSPNGCVDSYGAFTSAAAGMAAVPMTTSLATSRQTHHFSSHSNHHSDFWHLNTSSTVAASGFSTAPAAHAQRLQRLSRGENSDGEEMPLNLTVNSSASSSTPHRHSTIASSPPSHFGASAAAAAVAALSTGNCAQARALESYSPGIAETGRRVVTQNGLVCYSAPVQGASLPNMEAKTCRDVDSDTCDPAIEEHFRRSLGSAYASAFASSGVPGAMATNRTSSSSSSSSSLSRTPSPRSSPPTAPTHPHLSSQPSADSRVKLVSVSGTVDEHFAKALGKQTWKQLNNRSGATENVQRSPTTNRPGPLVLQPSSNTTTSQTCTCASPSSSTTITSSTTTSNILDVDEHFNRALGADTWLRIRQDVTSHSAAALRHHRHPFLPLVATGSGFQ